MTADRIEREITIEAPIERVWSILTEPEHLAVWFGPGTPEVDLRPGGIMTIEHGEKMVFHTRVEQVDPPRYLAYRWASAYPGEVADDHNSTLVEFTLTPASKGTRLHLVESGFSTFVVPSGQERDESYESHSTGWTEVLGNLSAHAQSTARAH